MVSVTKPDGSTLISSTPCGTTCFLDTATLPTTGTYTIKVDPQGTTTGSLTAQVYNVPTDPTASLTVGDTTKTVTTTSGQNATFTFTGTAGQLVSISLTNNIQGSTSFTVNGPDGAMLASTTVSGNAAFSHVTLPTIGTYSILINPNGTAAGSVIGGVAAG